MFACKMISEKDIPMNCDICGSDDKVAEMVDGIYRCFDCADEFDTEYFVDGLFYDPREEAPTPQERNPGFRDW